MADVYLTFIVPEAAGHTVTAGKQKCADLRVLVGRFRKYKTLRGRHCRAVELYLRGSEKPKHAIKQRAGRKYHEYEESCIVRPTVLGTQYS